MCRSEPSASSSQSPSARDARVDRLDTDPVEEAQADLDRREVEVVDGAVFEVRSAGGRLVVLALHERRDDRSAREPRPLELGERRLGGRAGSPRRLASRTSCRTRSRRSPDASGSDPAGWSGRTRRRRAARPSHATGPARSIPTGAERRRSSTAPGRRAGCGDRRRCRSGSAAAGPRRRADRARRSARTWSRRPVRGRTRGSR